VIMKEIAAKVREAKPTLATMEATNAGKPFPEVSVIFIRVHVPEYHRC
jgi:hypothetical protein